MKANRPRSPIISYDFCFYSSLIHYVSNDRLRLVPINLHAFIDFEQKAKRYFNTDKKYHFSKHFPVCSFNYLVHNCVYFFTIKCRVSTSLEPAIVSSSIPIYSFVKSIGENSVSKEFSSNERKLFLSINLFSVRMAQRFARKVLVKTFRLNCELNDWRKSRYMSLRIGLGKKKRIVRPVSRGTLQ